jgi:plastocyanin
MSLFLLPHGGNTILRTKMNVKEITKTRTMIKKPSTIIAAATIMMMVVSAVMSFGMQGQISHSALAQTYVGIGTAAAATTSASNSPVSVNPNQSTNKEFWINTVHLDGMTNLNAAKFCDTCSQNTPLHPAEKPPVNSTIPTGGGFRITEPNKVGAWDFRSFTFSPDQIVVNQGDIVTLNFVGVQGVHHLITVDGVGSFPLLRGQIHTISFTANSPGTINYYCHIHMPNMVGQILVLPKSV